MTNTPKLAIAIGYIDDDLVTGAAEYMPKKKAWHQKNWFRLSAIAACLALLVIIPITRFSNQQPTIQQPTIDSAGIGDDNYIELSFEEALSHIAFGKYFPQTVADGYYLESEVYVDGEEYLEAAFINDENGDLLLLRIAPRSRFDNIETDTVFYRSEDQTNKASFIYVDCGEYIALYSSKKCDLQTLPGFDKMMRSAEYFN